MKEKIRNSILKKGKGAITLYVTVACLFIMAINIANFVLISNKQTLQIEQLRQLGSSNSNETSAEEIGKSYENGDIIPKQMSLVGSYEGNNIIEDKAYTFTDDKTNMFYAQSEDLITIINNIVDSKIQQNIELNAYPVGSIYISVTNTNPGEIFGGTWVAYGTGRTLVGVDETQTEFNTVEKTGGEKTHTLTIAEMPSHGRHLYGVGQWFGYGNYSAYLDQSKLVANGSTGRGWDKANGNEIYPTGQNLGGGAAHNNLQPYITVYMWKRIQ